jgi:hypothetical protein
MENVYDKVVKLTAEILKSWKSDPGVISPFSSSSSSHNEQNDNHLEHYVKQGETSENSDVSSIFNSNLFTNGGQTMTEKTLDVETSSTVDSSYENAVTATTEPDAESAIAITKSAEIPHTQVGTTANTTTEAPKGGETTEPMEKAADCPDCGKAMTLCECAGMTKAADEAESKEEEAKETPADEKKEKEEIKKSIWGGAFAPQLRGKL